MSAPVFHLPDLSPDRPVLTGPEGHHAAAVRRVAVGEAVDLVDGCGGRARCEVVAVARDRVELQVRQRSAERPPQPALVLVQALAKGDHGESAVTLATEAGVDAVIPWAAARSVVRWQGERGERAHRRWGAAAREAAKQSRRAWFPPVRPALDLAGLVALAATTPALVLHEQATEPLATCALPPAGELLVVVGPEGGVSDAELAALTGAGATAVRLGPTVLRTSTAGVAAVAVLSARLGRWS